MKRIRRSLNDALIPLLSILVSVALSAGCDELSTQDRFVRSCQFFGICDEASLPPELFDILCDASIGSSCTRETLDKALDVVLRRTVTRPGSHTRVWALTKTVADTNATAEKESPSPPHRSSRATKVLKEKFVADSKEYFTAALAPTFATTPIRRSPLAEAITKIALADSGQLPRHLIVITDAREVSSLGDFECGLLPTDAGFMKKLRRRRIMGPAILAGIRVEFAFAQSMAVPSRGCPVQLERELRIRELWTAALTAAGAKSVSIRTGPPSVDMEDSPAKLTEKETKP